METLAGMLEDTGGFRILRRLDVQLTPLPDRLDGRLALFVDVDTSGLDPSMDEVVRFAVVPFQYDRHGRILAVHEPFDGPHGPGIGIPRNVAHPAGIGGGMGPVGYLDVPTMDRLTSAAALVVAHNAAFDRAFLERTVPAFAVMPWACSMSDVPWRDEGLTGLALELLAAQAGFFFRAHRAVDDCLAGIELLRRPLPRSGRLAMAELLRSARRDTMRVAAAGVPFARRGLVRQRGYRWRPAAASGEGMAWVTEVAAEAVDAEVRFLRTEVYGRAVDPTVTRISAYDRYSSRV